MACRLLGLKSWSPPGSKQQLAVLKVEQSDSNSHTVLAVRLSSSLDGRSGSDSQAVLQGQEEDEVEWEDKSPWGPH